MFNIDNNFFLKYYLTSVEPDMSQSIYSQSLGGHFSTSPVYPEAILDGTIGIYDKSLVIDDYTDLENINYINIGSENIKVNAIENNNIIVEERGINNLISSHVDGSVVRGISSNNILNDIFNDDLKQYRCYAIKNIVDYLESNQIIFRDVSISLKQDSINPKSSIRFAVERPLNDFLSSLATGGTTSVLVDSSLIGLFVDDHFKSSVIRFRTGSSQGKNRIIESFDSSTGEITFETDLSSTVLSGDEYTIDPSPSQRVSSGLVEPSVGSGVVSGFYSTGTSVSIDINSRDHGAELRPNDVVYIWVERELEKNSEEFIDNSFVINVNYSSIIGS